MTSPAIVDMGSEMSSEKQGRMIWLDLEMTGLDPDQDSIIELALVVTDDQLHPLAEFPAAAIGHTRDRLEAMDTWNRTQHRQSGLWQRVVESSLTHQDVQAQAIAFLTDWVAAGSSPMCGNSICQDRRFLSRQMPALMHYFHYRNLDVSTLKELARRWAPEIYRGFVKVSAHTALSDIYDSIDELHYYRRYMGALAGLASSD